MKKDVPINKVDEDILGRKPIIETLKKELIEYKDYNSICMGIYGKWGSGKTSFINLLCNEEEIEDEFIIIKFNPWYLESYDDLFKCFFLTINNNIEKQSIKLKLKDKFKNDNIKEISTKIINLICLLVDIYSKTSATSNVIKTVLSQIKKNSYQKQKNDIFSLKKDLNDLLSKINTKILVVVDDIDRLSKKEILTLFKFIKGIGDLNNFIYILVMDDEYVCKSIKGDVINSDEYIQKIVQVPYYLPPINKQVLWEYYLNNLDNRLYRLLKKYYYNEKNRVLLLKNIFDEYIINIRNIKRVLNYANNNYKQLSGNFDVIDYLVISFIIVLDNGLYKFIYDSKELLVSEKLNKIKIEKVYQSYKEDIKLKDKEIEFLIEELFPNLMSNNVENLNFRICDRKYFDNYFMFNIENNIYTIQNYKSFENLDEYEMANKFDKLEDTIGVEIYDFYTRLFEYFKTEKVILKKIYKATYLIQTKIEMKHYETESIFRGNKFLLESLIHKVNIEHFSSNQELFYIYKDIIETNDIKAIEVLATDINDYEINYGRINGYQRSTYDYISENNLELLEKSLVNSLEFITKSNKLFLGNNLYLIMHLWQSINESSCDNAIRNLLSDDIKKVTYISKFVYIIQSSEENLWSINENLDKYIYKYLNIDDLIRVIEADDFSILGEFKEDELTMKKIIAFYLIKTEGLEEIEISKVKQKLNEISI